MPVLKLNHGQNFYLVKVPKALKTVFDNPEVIQVAGATLDAMGVQPFNVNPSQALIEVSLETDPDGNQELSFKTSLPVPDSNDTLASPARKRSLFTVKTPQKDKDLHEDNDLPSKMNELSPFKKNPQDTFRDSTPFELEGISEYEDITMFEDSSDVRSHNLKETSSSTTSVLAHNIMAPFHEDIFKFEMESAMQDAGLISEGETPFTIINFNAANNTVTMQFDSRTLAREFCLACENLSYDKNLLLLEIVEQLPSMSSKVELFNILPPFNKKFLLSTLNNAIWGADIIQKPLHAIRHCPDCLSSDSSATIEFESTEVANKFCALPEVVYRGQRLLRVQLPLSLDPCLSTADEATSVGNDAEMNNEGISDEDDNVEKIPLSSPEGTKIFFRHLVRLRNSFASSNHDGAYTRLLADLIGENVEASITSLKAKRKYLLAKYNKVNKETWEYGPVCAVIKGEKNISTLEGTDFDPKLCKCSSSLDPTFAGQLKKFRKGAPWTVTATRCLIEVYGLVKHLFDEPNRHTQLWKEISKKLGSQRTLLSA